MFYIVAEDPKKNVGPVIFISKCKEEQVLYNPNNNIKISEYQDRKKLVEDIKNGNISITEEQLVIAEQRYEWLIK